MPRTSPKEILKHMKKFALLLSLVFVAGVAVADEAKTAAASQTAEKAAAAPAAKTHEVEAVVVSVDAEKNTITIKGEKENKTSPVDAKAASALKTVKAGDKVILTCSDDAKGAHEKVVAIKAATAAAAPEKK